MSAYIRLTDATNEHTGSVVRHEAAGSGTVALCSLFPGTYTGHLTVTACTPTNLDTCTTYDAPDVELRASGQSPPSSSGYRLTASLRARHRPGGCGPRREAPAVHGRRTRSR